MATFTFNIDARGAMGNLERLQSSLKDFSPALEKSAGDFRAMIEEQFSSGGEAGGTPWAPLAPSTLRRRRMREGSILDVTGALLDSLVSQGDVNHAETVGPLELTIGSELGYAGFIQAGTGWGRGEISSPPPPHYGRGMPMRPMLVLTEEHAGRWVEFVWQQIENTTGADPIQQTKGR